MRAKTLVISASLLLLALTPLAAQSDLSATAGSGAFELAPVAPAPVAPAPVESEMQQESTQAEPLEPGDNAESSEAASAETSAVESQAVETQVIESQTVESQTVEATTAPQVESQAVSELPSTASPLALVALFGLGSAGAAFGLRFSRRARK